MRVARRSNASPAFATPLRTVRAAAQRDRQRLARQRRLVDHRLARHDRAVDRHDLAGCARAPGRPTTTDSTGTSSSAPPRRRCAIWGARSAGRELALARGGRPNASSALPPRSISATIAPARYSPSARAPPSRAARSRRRRVAVREAASNRPRDRDQRSAAIVAIHSASPRRRARRAGARGRRRRPRRQRQPRRSTRGRRHGPRPGRGLGPGSCCRAREHRPSRLRARRARAHRRIPTSDPWQLRTAFT